MDVGLYIEARPDIAPVAKAAEEAGFTHLWVYDSPLLFSDTTVSVVRALDATDRLKVGPGVANPRQRPAPHAAQLVATLSKIAPGRVAFGLGTGASARLSLGMQPATMGELLEYAGLVRGMIRGEMVTYREGDREAQIQFVHPDGRWIDTSCPAPIWLSAFGSKGRGAAPAVSDGVIARWEGPAAARAAREEVDTGALAVGRRPGEIEFGVVYAVLPIRGESELETPEVRAAIGPLVMSRLRYLAANADGPDDVSEGLRDAFVAYRSYQGRLDPEVRHIRSYRGYLVFTPADLEHLVTPQTIRAVACAGSADDIMGEMAAMARSGVDQVGLQIAGDVVGYCHRMARSVIPATRALSVARTSQGRST